MVRGTDDIAYQKYIVWYHSTNFIVITNLHFVDRVQEFVKIPSKTVIWNFVSLYNNEMLLHKIWKLFRGSSVYFVNSDEKRIYDLFIYVE